MFVAKIRTEQYTKPNCLCPCFLPPPIPRDCLSGPVFVKSAHCLCVTLTPVTPPVLRITKGCAEKKLHAFLHIQFSFSWKTVTDYRVKSCRVQLPTTLLTSSSEKRTQSASLSPRLRFAEPHLKHLKDSW